VMRAQRDLFERGFHVIGVRPPTVPAGTARLRVTLSAEHSLEEVEALAAFISDGRRRWC
jgi:8-amino-7-oxononanoate synthase